MNNLGTFNLIENFLDLYSFSKAQLIQIRDNLLFNLISQLSFNRTLISQNHILTTTKEIPKSAQCKIEQKKQEPYVILPPSTEMHQKTHRKLIRKSHKQTQKSTLGVKNDTKNIPKNYGKAILSYILRSPKTRKLSSSLEINLPDFLIYIRKMKGKINSIQGLKKMWGCENLDNKTKKCVRILSYQFMRKHCLRYIFHSKVRNYGTHIKYRQKIIEGIENPQKFNHIKDY